MEPDGSTPQDMDAYRVKGRTFRAHLEYLRQNGMLEAVLGRVGPEAAELMVEPPLPGRWIPGRLLDEILVAVQALKGSEAVLVMERSVIRGPLSYIFMPVVQFFLGILGASPAALAPRLPAIARGHVEGIEFAYQARSETSGSMTVRFATERAVPMTAFLSAQAAMEHVLTVCGKKGIVNAPKLLDAQSARIDLEW